MKMNEEKKKVGYTQYVESKEPATKYFPSLIFAFVIGGLICCLGQGIGDIAKLIWPRLSQTEVVAIASTTLVFLASLLTALGVFDKIAVYAGAGTIVPITGFSNSIASAALEFKNEGLVFGTGAKIFNIAGPVILNGVAFATIIGLVYLIFGM